MAIGLQTHIWDNNLKSIVLLALYPVILAVVVWAGAGVVGMTMAQNGDLHTANDFAWGFIYAYWPAIVAVVGIWFMVAWFFHGAMIRKLSHSHPVTRADEPELYNLFENLCISVGLPTPRLEIIESHARNAFASGIDTKSYAVTVTRGLLQSLSKDELEGVLAHELTHILNRDVRVLMVCVIFTGMLGFAAQMLWSSMRYSIYAPRRSSGNNGKGSGIIVLFGLLAVLWVGYIATLFMRFALSRRREYMADAGAVQMTKNPDAMMRALMRIAGMDAVPAMPGDIQMMCIENRVPFMGLFATHPPIESRIRVISETTGTPVPAVLPKMRAGGDERFQTPAADGRDNWLTRGRFGRKSNNPWIR
jgi:heat shock protein HtpX